MYAWIWQQTKWCLHHSSSKGCASLGHGSIEDLNDTAAKHSITHSDSGGFDILVSSSYVELGKAVQPYPTMPNVATPARFLEAQSSYSLCHATSNYSSWWTILTILCHYGSLTWTKPGQQCDLTIMCILCLPNKYAGMKTYYLSFSYQFICANFMQSNTIAIQ